MNEPATQQIELNPESEAIAVLDQPPQAIDVLERAQIDMQIATARKYPRSVKTFLAKAETLATLNEEIAASCFYALPRANKKIEGPGIRLAEITASCWGNLRYGTRIVGETEDRKRIIAEGFAHDLETNTFAAVRIERRITDKYGKRYSDDMIAVTGNAASSIALRNVIFKVVPFAYVQPIYLKAKALAVGDIKSLADRRITMLERFGKMGIVPERILTKLKKKAIEDVNLEDMEELYGLFTALKDGELDIDTAFPLVAAENGNREPKNLAEKVKSKAPLAPEAK